MAFESKNFNVAKKILLPESEFGLDCTIEAESEIKKIFTISAEAFVDSKEVLSGTISYAGSVDLCMIYLNESGEVCSTHTSCVFNSKFDSDKILTDQKAVLNVCVSGYEITNVATNSVSVKLNIKQAGFVVFNEEVKSLSVADENIATKEETIKVINFIGEGKKDSVIEASLLTREPIKKLLLCETQSSIKNVEAGLNFATVSGDIVARVLYLTESDRFESAYIFDTFKEEIELEGVTENSFVEANSFVRYLDVKALVDNEEKGAKISLSVPVDIFSYAYDENEISVVADLYSTKQDSQVAVESFNMTKSLPAECIESKIDGTLVIDDESPRIDKILFSGGNLVTLTNLFIEDGVINAEGISKTNVIYLNDDTNTLNSVEVEVPFSVKSHTEIPEDAQIFASVSISDVDVAVKKGRELFYDAKVKVFVYAKEDVVSAVMTDVVLLDEAVERDYAMEVVFAKAGQDAWDIAKAAKVKESMVIMQNPNLVFPLVEDSEVILFYQNS